MITAEVSLYPVETTESDEVIMNSLQALDDFNLHSDIGSLSTHMSGDPEEIWSALRSMFERAQQTGQEIVMTVTVSNTG